MTDIDVSPVGWHGLLHEPDWSPPRCTLKSSEPARVGYSGTLAASEYEDDETTLGLKVKMLANLINASQRLCVYSGAGISTSSGIADYASARKGSLPPPKPANPYLAAPTSAHYALAALQREGHLKNWVQQNHDGLPQKAGCPQQVLNEIHGAWFDPANPVVPMSGQLRADLFARLAETEESCDLCLSLGTSMVGMNADRVFTSVCERANSRDARALGGVIVNKQVRASEASAMKEPRKRKTRVPTPRNCISQRAQ
jgi:NAD-dependent SIR2 family protein deacetylase